MYISGIFFSEFGSVIRTQSQCKIGSFSQMGTKNLNLVQTVKVKFLSTKIECIYLYTMHKLQKTRAEKG